jgi:hypothetical protein
MGEDPYIGWRMILKKGVRKLILRMWVGLK